MSDEVREAKAGDRESGGGEASKAQSSRLLTKIKKNRSRNPLQK